MSTLTCEKCHKQVHECKWCKGTGRNCKSCNWTGQICPDHEGHWKR